MTTIRDRNRRCGMLWAMQLFALCVSAFLVPMSALANDSYPSRPVTIVVSFPPGGVVDIHARAFAPTLGEILKQPVVVLNKVGAAGAVGIQFVAMAKPDGYTLLMTTNSMTIGPEVAKVTGQSSLYTRDQFSAIGQLSVEPPLLVVRPDDEFKSVGDIVTLAKRAPGKIEFSSAGIYSAPHVAMHLFASTANVDLWHVPFSGSPPALAALLGKQVRMLALPPSIVGPHLKSGAVRIMATWGDKRNPSLPLVPTLREAGVDTHFDMWTGVFVHQDVPTAINESLRVAFRRTAETPEVIKRMANVGTEISFVDGPQFEKILDNESIAMEAAIRSIGRIAKK